MISWGKLVERFSRKDEPPHESLVVGEAVDPSPFNKFDRSTAVWKKIEAHIESRLQTLRSRNDKNLDAYDTASVRGRIAELKSLAMLGEERRRTEEE